MGFDPEKPRSGSRRHGCDRNLSEPQVLLLDQANDDQCGGQHARDGLPPIQDIPERSMGLLGVIRLRSRSISIPPSAGSPARAPGDASGGDRSRVLCCAMRRCAPGRRPSHVKDASSPPTPVGGAGAHNSCSRPWSGTPTTSSGCATGSCGMGRDRVGRPCSRIKGDSAGSV
jgi:hypothetical protein